MVVFYSLYFKFPFLPVLLFYSGKSSFLFCSFRVISNLLTTPFFVGVYFLFCVYNLYIFGLLKLESFSQPSGSLHETQFVNPNPVSKSINLEARISSPSIPIEYFYSSPFSRQLRLTPWILLCPQLKRRRFTYPYAS